MSLLRHGLLLRKPFRIAVKLPASGALPAFDCRICSQARTTKTKSKKQAAGNPRSHVGNGSAPGQSAKEAPVQKSVPVIGTPPDADPEQHEGRFFDAVVKVYCIHTEPNYSLPWQRKRQYSSTSSGFMVKNVEGQQCLLTNAHSVEYHTQVKVKRRGDDQKFIAEVLAIGIECDIALLTVKDETFWEGVQPLSFGPLPRLQDAVAVVGYPIGGDTISVTSGVVSRIEVTSYVHGSTELLGVQIDAAINSGNSGGPVFNEVGECVGIAFQSLAGGDAENIGYVIPTPVIQHFLSDFRQNGRFTGFPVMGMRWQRMESHALRSAYGMKKQQKGVLVRHIQPTYETAKHLRPDDIIMKFDGIQVASDGTVPFREKERIAFNYLTSQKYSGEHAVLDVWREEEEVQLTVQLMRPRLLVPLHLANADPSFFVVAGIIFTVCSEPYLLSEYGVDYMSEAPVKLLERLMHGERAEDDEQVVILSQVLACEATLGYEDYCNVQVLKFNGTPVRNLRHLTELVSECQEKYMRFDLAYREVITLKTDMVEDATASILEMHSIPAAVSKDLMAAVPAKQPANDSPSRVAAATE